MEHPVVMLEPIIRGIQIPRLRVKYLKRRVIRTISFNLIMLYWRFGWFEPVRYHYNRDYQ